MHGLQKHFKHGQVLRDKGCFNPLHQSFFASCPSLTSWVYISLQICLVAFFGPSCIALHPGRVASTPWMFSSTCSAVRHWTCPTSWRYDCSGVHFSIVPLAESPQASALIARSRSLTSQPLKKSPCIPKPVGSLFRMLAFSPDTQFERPRKIML